MIPNQDDFRRTGWPNKAAWCALLTCFSTLSSAIASEPQGNSPGPVTEIPEGYYLFEGDILLPIGRATYDTSLWPNGVVPFQFDGNVTSNGWRQSMFDAMEEWEAVANVDFVARNGESNFLHIQNATFNASEGVGMDGAQHNIWILNWTFGVLAHELGHALAYWHEQSRADRDAFVQIEWDSISQSACNGSCDSQFEIRSGGGEYGPYDFDSIMHYRACSFSCCGGVDSCQAFACTPATPACRTITVLPPFDVDWQANIGQRDHLSVFDALTMSFLYPEPNWRFVEQGAGGSDAGTFRNPYRTFSRAMSQIPTGHTLWFLEPDHYSAVNSYSRAMTWRAAHGTVTLGN